MFVQEAKASPACTPLVRSVCVPHRSACECSTMILTPSLYLRNPSGFAEDGDMGGDEFFGWLVKEEKFQNFVNGRKEIALSRISYGRAEGKTSLR